MTYFEDIINIGTPSPYSLPSGEKSKIFVNLLNELTAYHMKNSCEYNKILINTFGKCVAENIEDVPYIPVRLFKLLELKSIPDSQIFKVLTSSGTSGQSVSKIFLDRENAITQSKVLRSIVSDILGEQRLPMLILDAEDLLKDRSKLGARAAGVVGFSIFGRNNSYALDPTLKLKLQEVVDFCSKYRETGIFIFGFTFVIWKYFYLFLKNENLHLDLGPKSRMLHGGGWKKLADESVTNEKFKSDIFKRTNIQNIHNYYGMIEQTGSIYMECKFGYFHTSNYSDIIIRDEITHKPLRNGEQGLIQVISLLPRSYPGHSLLTEDIGVCLGEDTCACGRLGKYFHVHGRLKSSEVRGCSDARQY